MSHNNIHNCLRLLPLKQDIGVTGKGGHRFLMFISNLSYFSVEVNAPKLPGGKNL